MKSRIIVCGRPETEKTELLKTVIAESGMPTIHSYSVGTVYDTPTVTFSTVPYYRNMTKIFWHNSIRLFRWDLLQSSRKVQMFSGTVLIATIVKANLSFSQSFKENA